MVPSGQLPEVVIPLETQVVRQSLTIESTWGPGGAPAAIDTGSGAPAEALLLALRRAWRTAESRRLAGAYAPAGRVARAVGTLLVGAATHELRGATRGATAGCTPGVARMVQGVVTRHVHDALPVALGVTEDGPEPVPAPAPEPGSLSFGLALPPLPAPGWWCREPAWTPRIVAEPLLAPPGGAGSALAAALWPPLPDAPERGAAARPPLLRRPVGPDPVRERQAWAVLAAELQPAEWSMAPRAGAPAAHGGM